MRNGSRFYCQTAPIGFNLYDNEEKLRLAHGYNARVHAHAVAAIVIIGRTPKEEDKQAAFEQYRNSLKDVLVITFDELQERLESIHRALTPQTPAELEPINDEDLPF